jgi:hypothetical protein
MMGGNYTVYGLSLNSEIPLPELIESPPDREPDITVELAPLSENLERRSANAEGYFLCSDSICFNVPGVAKYQIRGGSEIIVDPYPEGPAEGIRLFLLGSGLGALLHLLGRTPFHASTIRVDDVTVAFSSDSGGGKSTLAAFLLQRGYVVTGDDVSALEPTASGEVLSHPGVPRIRLLPDVMDALGLSAGRDESSSKTDKKYPLANREDPLTAPAPLRRIYFLEFAEDAGSPVLIQPMGRYEALIELRKNVYRPSLVAELGRERDFFEWAKRALFSVSFFRLSRPKDLGRLDEAIDSVEAHLEDLRDARDWE